MSDYDEVLLTALEEAYESCDFTDDKYTLLHCMNVVKEIADEYSDDLDVLSYVLDFIKSRKHV